jgi:hypothetical protein
MLDAEKEEEQYELQELNTGVEGLFYQKNSASAMHYLIKYLNPASY